MLESRKSDTSVLWSGPVNHADVLVRVGDAMNVQKARREKRAGARLGRRRTLAEQLDFQSTLLSRLTQGSLFRVLIQFNVPAERQPLVQLAMVNQQNLAVVNDENRHSEINLFMNVRHA